MMDKTRTIAIAIMVIIVLIAALSTRFKTRKHYEVRKAMRLFPFWIKYPAILLSIASAILHWRTLADEPTVLNSFWQFGLTLGLILVGLSKERNEDEMTMSIRLNSVFISFFSGIFAHTLIVLTDILYEGEVNSYDALYVTNYMLIMYVLVFHFYKKKMQR